MCARLLSLSVLIFHKCFWHVQPLYSNSTIHKTTSQPICTKYVFDFPVSLKSKERKTQNKMQWFENDVQINNWHLNWYTISKPWVIRHFVIIRLKKEILVVCLEYPIQHAHHKHSCMPTTIYIHSFQLKRIWKITRWQIFVSFSLFISLSRFQHRSQISNLYLCYCWTFYAVSPSRSLALHFCMLA